MLTKFKYCFLFFAASALLLLHSCKSEDGNKIIPAPASITIAFETTVNGKPFYMDSVYQSEASQSYLYLVQTLKFYISNFSLSDGSKDVLLKEVDLVDFGTNTTHTFFDATVEAGNYDLIKFGLGLDSAKNNSDNTQYPPMHPMNHAYGMFWDWNLKYAFIAFGGRMDTTNVGDKFNKPFAIEPGFDKNYKNLVLQKKLKIENGNSYNITIQLDLHKVLFNQQSPTSFRTNSISHTDTPLADLFTENFKNAISIK